MNNLYAMHSFGSPELLPSVWKETLALLSTSTTSANSELILTGEDDSNALLCFCEGHPEKHGIRRWRFVTHSHSVNSTQNLDVETHGFEDMASW